MRFAQTLHLLLVGEVVNTLFDVYPALKGV
ncbi:Uncharacterised protein [Vibrio cholerae]|nr:Uncharacterised protein [Vibrio cholerae]